MITAERVSYTYLSGDIFDDGVARKVKAPANKIHRCHSSNVPGNIVFDINIHYLFHKVARKLIHKKYHPLWITVLHS